MDTIECNVITINNIEYTEIDKINYNNNTYIFLANIDNPSDYMIRKLTIKNNEEYLSALSNEEEFKELLNIFKNKYTN